MAGRGWVDRYFAGRIQCFTALKYQVHEKPQTQQKLFETTYVKNIKIIIIIIIIYQNLIKL